MDPETFRRHAHTMVDWVADYLAGADRYPVLSPLPPGAVKARLPATAPLAGEPMEDIWRDFEEIVLPGITHWNHPSWFAYFPANHSAPSILGELLSAALGVNAMVWQSSPAATELEERVMDWLRQLIGLPDTFRGVIQDTASSATLVALLCARERTTGFATNTAGFPAGAGGGALRVYASTEAHSSVEKGAKIAGFGAANFVTIDTDEDGALDVHALARQIAADRSAGLRPCAVVATIGTTSSTAIDPVADIARVAADHDLWLHVDAALAGAAAILPEKRHLFAGIGQVDSFVFNPHKWLFTNFDCSAFFCRDPDLLVRTLAIDPEYLKTDRDSEVVNYRDWGIPLGRRFRALKLWFVLRSYGIRGLQERLREHLRLAQEFAGWIDAYPDFERLAPVPLQTVCFRYHPPRRPGEEAPPSEEDIEAWNRRLLAEVNGTGRVFMTHTRLRGRYALRLSIGQTETRHEHVRAAYETLVATAETGAGHHGTLPESGR